MEDKLYYSLLLCTYIFFFFNYHLVGDYDSSINIEILMEGSSLWLIFVIKNI